ncbi:hypothetical protein ACGFX8_36715 [Streptomyces sp. NPDC048362]|uniref:hypothetical protein n=1 Tax=Streptomyces sp. NPDC048362 TaxID=3365539 RepID=UPI0037110019
MPQGARKRGLRLPIRAGKGVGGWVCFEDEAGAWLNGPVRRTWGKAGQTPVLRLSGKRNNKISMVAWICFKDGEDPQMIYAIKPSGGYRKRTFPGSWPCRTAAWTARSPSSGTAAVVFDRLGIVAGQVVAAAVMLFQWWWALAACC